MIPADIRDRDCAAGLIRKTRHLFPFLVKMFANGADADSFAKLAMISLML